MDQTEKSMIENLFSRLQQAEAQSGTRDTDAEGVIRDAIARQPAAPYYMAQVILVQEHALQNLNNRVQQLEQELTQRPAGGGFLSGLFGGGQDSRPAAADRPLGPQQSTPGAAQLSPQARGGSFMGGAVQTAAAVAGGVLLGNAIAGLFAGDAQAADVPSAEPSPSPNEPPEDDLGGFDDDESFF